MGSYANPWADPDPDPDMWGAVLGSQAAGVGLHQGQRPSQGEGRVPITREGPSDAPMSARRFSVGPHLAEA